MREREKGKKGGREKQTYRNKTIRDESVCQRQTQRPREHREKDRESKRRQRERDESDRQCLYVNETMIKPCMINRET